MKRRIVGILLALLSLLLMAISCGTEQAEPERDWLKPDPAALQAWQEMRFGMFIHWGPVSLTGHEIGWSRGRETPVEEYDQLYKKFNPTKFDADAWVRTAKEAGMKYMVITTKHHDGFVLWPSRYTDYDLGESPFKRDVLKELSEACKKQGVKFGTYYSTCDWHHPDFPLGSPGGTTKKPNPNLERYTEYLRNQVEELITNYGPLSTIWFDVPQETPSDIGIPTTVFVRKLQPTILMNDRIFRAGLGTVKYDRREIGDYSTPEQRVGAFDRERPWETCMTIGDQWAWKPNDRVKSLAECLRVLVVSAAGDGNLLFNVGPKPDGEIEPPQVERLREMGAWLKKNGESIYATRGGPYKPIGNIASTCKGNKVYLHLLGGLDGAMLPATAAEITGASVLGGGEVTLEKTDGAVKVAVDKSAVDDIDTIVVLELDKPAFDIEPVDVPYVKAVGADTYYRFASLTGAVATASSQRGTDERSAAANAADGNSESAWMAGDKEDQWLEIDLGKEMTFGAVLVDELRGHVQQYELQRKAGEKWVTVLKGDTLGSAALLSFKPVTAQHIRLTFPKADGSPLISEVRVLEKL